MTLKQFSEFANEVYAAEEEPPTGRTDLGNYNPRLDNLLLHAARQRGLVSASAADLPVPAVALRTFYYGFNWQGGGWKADEVAPQLRPWFLAGRYLGRP